MTDETTYGASHERTKIAVLREAVGRADHLASAQAKIIEVQDVMIDSLNKRIRALESENSELRTALAVQP